MPEVSRVLVHSAHYITPLPSPPRGPQTVPLTCHHLQHLLATLQGTIQLPQPPADLLTQHLAKSAPMGAPIPTTTLSPPSGLTPASPTLL